MYRHIADRPIPLPSLPHEILLEILSHITLPSVEQQDLLTFASVHPTWHHVATPLLRRIAIGYPCRGDLFLSMASLYGFFAIDSRGEIVREVSVGFNHLMDAAKVRVGEKWLGAEYGFPSPRMALVDAAVELLKLVSPICALRLDLGGVEEEDFVILKYFFARLKDEEVCGIEIKQLELEKWIELDSGNEWITSLTGLEKVVVNGWTEGDPEGLGEALAKVKGIKHAAIEGNEGICFEVVGRMVGRWGALVSLNVEGSLNLAGSALLKIVAKVCRRLEHLWFGVAELELDETEESASAVEAVLKGCAKLRTLCAPRYRRIKDRTLRNILKHGSSLETLDLRGCPVTGVVPPDDDERDSERERQGGGTTVRDWRNRFEGRFGGSTDCEREKKPQFATPRRRGTEIQTINTPKLKHLGLDSPTLRPQLARRIMLACPQLVEFVVDEKCKAVLPARVGRTSRGEAFEKALGGVFLESAFM